jgi:hypothetical protein
MPVDIRCTVSCSLGTVISGSVSDDYIQGTGLIKCTGSVVIADVITPAIGTAVTISYTKGGVTRTIPRKLRVLSSFADPFRATTSVELGCKLTYLQDKRDQINWTAFDDPGNTLTEADAEIITLPIAAASIAGKCLTELGITSSGLGLSNYFSIAKFDLSGGYVSVLSDLLVSESRCGYLDADEVLQVFNLDANGGTGPAFDATQLVDISKIGMGQLPGEAVTVSYSTLKLTGQVQQTRPEAWDRQLRTQSSKVLISYTPVGTTSSVTKTYNILQTTETVTTYTELTKSDGEVLRLVSQRVETFTSGTAKEAGGLLQQYLAAGIAASNATVSKTTTETYTYDNEGNTTKVDRIVEGALAFAAGALSVPITFGDGSYVSINLSSNVQLERQVTETITLGNVQQITTTTYAPWWSEQNGQQTIAESRNSLINAASVSSWINAVVSAGLNIVDTNIDTVATIKPVSVPTTAEVNNQAAAIGGDPNNGYRTESTSQLALAVGSASAQRRIEFSLPHAPDDRFYKVGSTYGSYPSDAPQKAKLYGRVQNRLLLGNRNGMNIQLAPELMPTAPFAPFTITAKGATAQYRANGTSWTFDASGMVVATDALFWGGVGGTFASRWFPVAPGITSLPTTPAVVDGQMTVANVVPVANETVLASGRLRLGIAVEGYSYSLELLTEVPALGVTVGIEASRIRPVMVPAAAVTMAAGTPRVAIGAAVKVPVAAMTMAAPVPMVVSGASVAVPVASVSVTGVVPDLVGRPKTQVFIPAGDIGIAALAPAVATGKAVAVPVAAITVAGAVPVVGAYDPSFSSVSLLLSMNGTNNSTTFTDSSNNAFTPTVYGNAKISTAQSKFGGASGLFDGNGDYFTYSDNAAFQLGTGAFTVEALIYVVSQANTYPTFLGSGVSSFTTGAVYFSAWGDNNPTPANRKKFGFGTFASGGIVQSTTSLATGQWYHIAVTRTGTTVRLFINGTLEATATNSESINLSASGLVVGACGWSNTTDAFNGYVDDLRITKGVARYTASFTVPSQAFPTR